MSTATARIGEEGEEGMLPVRPNRPLADFRPVLDYQGLHHAL